MNSFAKWTNIKYFTRAEKIACILYILGVANREQLGIVTGWSDRYIKDALNELRNQDGIPQQIKSIKEQLNELEEEVKKDPENNALQMKLRRVTRQHKNQMASLDKKRDQWLVIIKGSPKEPNFYTLGRKGIDMVKEIRGEPHMKNNEVSKRQIHHFSGVNEILMRIRRSGVVEKDWMSGRELSQYLAYYWNRKKHLVKKDELWNKDKAYLPAKPDAMIVLDQPYLLEFDASTESFIRLKQRMTGYFELYFFFKKYNMMIEPLPKYVLWVCEDEKRRLTIERAGKEALEEFCEFTGVPKNEIDRWNFPYMISFVEGEDTKFLNGEIKDVSSFV